MGSDKVVSLVHRRAKRLLGQVAAPGVAVSPEDEETIDAFVERVGEAIAGLLRPVEHAPETRGRPRLRLVRRSGTP